LTYRQASDDGETGRDDDEPDRGVAAFPHALPAGPSVRVTITRRVARFFGAQSRQRLILTEEEGIMRRIVLGLALLAFGAGVPNQVHAEDPAARQIANNLETSGALQGFRIGVRCNDGIAVLRGNVGSAQQKAAALGIAEQTQGVTRVVDELTVAGGGVQNAAFTGAPVPNGHMRATPRPFAVSSSVSHAGGPPAAMMAGGGGPPAGMMAGGGGPVPAYMPGVGGGVAPARYDQPHLPARAWPSYAAYPNYGAVTYPKQYSPTAWPYIGPFYPYPQVPLGWRKVTLEWDDGWWMLDFKARRH
jgi:hypothetical protein